MALVIVGLFLIVFGLKLLFGLAIPFWVTGLLAVIGGALLLADHFRIRVDKK